MVALDIGSDERGGIKPSHVTLTVAQFIPCRIDNSRLTAMATSFGLNARRIGALFARSPARHRHPPHQEAATFQVESWREETTFPFPRSSSFLPNFIITRVEGRQTKFQRRSHAATYGKQTNMQHAKHRNNDPDFGLRTRMNN